MDFLLTLLLAFAGIYCGYVLAEFIFGDDDDDDFFGRPIFKG